MEVLALQCHEKDNVAVVFGENLKSGTEVTVKDKKGNTRSITVKHDIPYGHKIALRNIGVGEEILKYGEAIGIATGEIEPGDYVHVHNLDSQRARGDWEKG